MEELQPSYIDEITRKTYDTLIRLEERRQSGEITEREFAIGLQTVFSVTAGLTNDFDSENNPHAVMRELTASINPEDSSFGDCKLFRSSFDDTFVGIQTRNGNALIFTGTIKQASHKARGVEETHLDFAKRIETAVKTKFANYSEWKI